MTPRARLITHPSGERYRTPLLVPSFSSKGFAPRKDGGSEVSELYEIATEYLYESQLVSAFDLHYGLLPKPASQLTQVTILDSGGYETSSYEDLSAITYEPPKRAVWTAEMHKAEVAAWPSHIAAIIVSFDSPDRRVSLGKQIEEGLELRRLCADQQLALLIKPETDDQKYVQVDNVESLASDLKPFDVIGFTEKELGATTLDRMVSLARIRQTLDKGGVDAPIHVFGCLDPITIPLFFIAGAEIFDGLSWMRYGFAESVAMYRFNVGALQVGIDRRDDYIRVRILQSNVEYLRDLGNRLTRFAVASDFSKLGEFHQLFQDSAELLAVRLKEV